MKKLLLALAALSLGCSSYDLTTPTQELLTGNWNLMSVNGTSLPFAPPHPGTNQQEVVADVLTLTAPNTFSEVTTVRITQHGRPSAKSAPSGCPRTARSRHKPSSIPAHTTSMRT